MKNLSHVLGFALLLVGIGCTQEVRTKGLIGPMESRLTGVVQESSTSKGHYALADGNRTRIRGQNLARSIDVGALLETEQYLRLKLSRWVDGKNFDYQLVFGPEPGSRKTATGRVLNQEPCFFVGDGWAFFWGLYPMVYTQYIDAGVEHSAILVQTVNSTLERIYLIEGSGLVVKCRGDETIEKTIDDLGRAGKGKYIEIRPGRSGEPACLMTDPIDVDDGRDSDSEVETFVGQATRIAREAGWPGPSPWIAVPMEP